MFEKLVTKLEDFIYKIVKRGIFGISFRALSSRDWDIVESRIFDMDKILMTVSASALALSLLLINSRSVAPKLTFFIFSWVLFWIAISIGAQIYLFGVKYSLGNVILKGRKNKNWFLKKFGKYSGDYFYKLNRGIIFWLSTIQNFAFILAFIFLFLGVLENFTPQTVK